MKSPIIAALLFSSLHSANAFHDKRQANLIPKKGVPFLKESDIFESSIQTRGGDEAKALDPVPTWLAIVGVLAPISSILLSLSPLPTVLDIIKKKSVGDLPLLPYSSIISNG